MLYQTKSTLDNDKIKEKLGEDIDIVNNIINECQSWLDDANDATTDEYKAKLDYFNTSIQPYMSKLYNENPEQNVNQEQNMNQEPTIDEVD